jgi:hypothetical protein
MQATNVSGEKSTARWVSSAMSLFGSIESIQRRHAT